MPRVDTLRLMRFHDPSHSDGCSLLIIMKIIIIMRITIVIYSFRSLHSAAIPMPSQMEKVRVGPKDFPDDDVFIVEELNAVPLRRDVPTVKKAVPPIRESADDIVILDSYNVKPKPVIHRDISTVGRLKPEIGNVDRDVCIVSYSR